MNYQSTSNLIAVSLACILLFVFSILFVRIVSGDFFHQDINPLIEESSINYTCKLGFQKLCP